MVTIPEGLKATVQEEGQTAKIEAVHAKYLLHKIARIIHDSTYATIAESSIRALLVAHDVLSIGDDHNLVSNIA
jgi:hypothetical protein